MRWQHISFQLKPIAWRKSVPICVLGEVHKNWEELNNALWSPAHLTTEDIKRLRTIGFSRLPIRGVVWWTHIIVLERFPSLPTFARNFSWEHSLPSTPLWTPLRASWWCWFLQISRKKYQVSCRRWEGHQSIVRPLLLLLEVSSSARVTTVNSTARA